jgi:hypothetical protein
VQHARAVITAAVVTAAIVLIFVTTGVTASARSEQSLLNSLGQELSSLHEALVVARDSTDGRIARATHLINWFEGTEDGGSAELVSAIAALTKPVSVPVGLASVADAAATGSLGEISESDLRIRLLELQRRLDRTGSTGALEQKAYDRRLEELLSPGMWRYVFFAESGEFPLDFKASLRELHEARFDRSVRSMLRGLGERRAELDGLEREVAALIDLLYGADGAPIQP